MIFADYPAIFAFSSKPESFPIAIGSWESAKVRFRHHFTPACLREMVRRAIMKKIKYYYNTNTLRYEKLEIPLRVKLLRVFGFIAAAIVTAAIISFLLSDL